MFCNFNHCKIFHANKLKVPLLEEQPKVRHYKLAKCKKFVRHVNPENIINVKIYNKEDIEKNWRAQKKQLSSTQNTKSLITAYLNQSEKVVR